MSMGALGDILVLGLGASGEAAAAYCAGLLGTEVDSVTAVDSGPTARVATRAERLAALGVRVHTGTNAIAGHYDLAIASPGIPPTAPLMVAARGACDRVISEIEFAWQRSKVPWVAVTGTNGKTTTTALIAHLLVEAGIPARPVGNFGPPAIDAVREGGGEALVAEVSSFQLSLTERFHPRVAVLLNITPDHIDWHGSMDAYAKDKAKVFSNLGADDVAVIDIDDPGSAPYADVVQDAGVHVARISREAVPRDGAGLADGILRLDTPSGTVDLCAIEELLIRGPHNVSNALAAAAAAHAFGASTSAIASGLRSFRPIEHRLEPVGAVCGGEWFNDSKATNPDAVLKALASFDERPLILLLGGRNKGSDMRPLASVAARRARAVVCFGEAGEEIADAFNGLGGADVTRVAGLTEAVDAAARLAEPGDAILLSPACASFDEFANYEERGRVFKRLVAELECGRA